MTQKQTLTVTEALTAQAMGSGTLPVYATPAVVALIEQTACQCITNLREGETTVGAYMTVDHIRPTAVGETVQCEAIIIDKEDRSYTFQAEVTNAAGEIVATAVHKRVRVDVERFMARLQKQK